MRLTVISDDKPGRKNLVAKHSLSLLVERDMELYLFGMGVDHVVLEHNAKELGVDLDIVDYVVVSHDHVPHYGGFRHLSSVAPFTDVFIPYGTAESLGRLLARNGLRPREVTTWIKVSEGVYISRPFYGPPYEHFAVFLHGDELVVLSGCMHPGLEALTKISEFFGKKIRAIIGGFHLVNAPDDVVNSYAKYLVERVQPSLVIPLHCSGERFLRELEKLGEVEVLELATGDRITV